MFDFGVSKHIYWGLILELVPGPAKQFKRVGIALLYPSVDPLFENKVSTRSLCRALHQFGSG